MRLLTGLILLVLTSTHAFADHHALNLVAGQSTDANITSIQLGEDLSIVTAEAIREDSSKIYITYQLTYNRDGTGGSFTNLGRNYSDANTIISGSGAGMWVRDGHLVRMTGIVSFSSGRQVLESIVLDPLERTLKIDFYRLEN